MEYSNNYSDTSGSLWQFKRDEIENNANNLTFANCSSFEYISKFVNNTDNTGNDAIANAAKAAFKITSAKLYAPIVTLLTADNAKLSKLLSKEFKRLVYWNKYKVIDNRLLEINDANVERPIRELLDTRYQGVKRLLVLAYDNTAGNNLVSVDSFKKHFLPRVQIES